MSKTTIALEAAVAAVLASMPTGPAISSSRQRANVDKAFVSILKIIAPRIRHFIRQYGLVAHWEDAEQCCAIAVHRAIQAYDPAKAQFTTFVNWQIRGELQSLRFRLMADQRPSAKKVHATTVSLHATTSSVDGQEASLESIIEDENALARTEAGASDYLAQAATASLVDAYIGTQRAAAIDQLRKRPQPKRAPAADAEDRGATRYLRSTTHGVCPIELEKLEQKLQRDKEIVERRVFDAATLDELGSNTGVTKERVRQITKRASRSIAELARTNPQFEVMADYRKTYVAPSRTRSRAVSAAKASEMAAILPPVGQAHNLLSRVVAIAHTQSMSDVHSQDIEDIEPSFVAAALDQMSDNVPKTSVRH